jgi:CheY-like chemotaxis protein
VPAKGGGAIGTIAPHPSLADPDKFRVLRGSSARHPANSFDGTRSRLVQFGELGGLRLKDAKIVLLMVDDDHLLHRTIDRAATAVGVEVIHAMTGSEAAPIATERKPDAILLDIGLPDVDGRDVLAQLKGLPAVAQIPIIMYSSHQEHEHRLSALQLGAENYVEKPFDPDLLLRRIMRAVEKSRGAGP